MEEIRKILKRLIAAANRRLEKEVKSESWAKAAETEAYRNAMQFALNLIELQIQRKKENIE